MCLTAAALVAFLQYFGVSAAILGTIATVGALIDDYTKDLIDYD